MVAEGLKSKEFAIEHVAQRGQWVPHTAMRRGEGPNNRAGSYSAIDVGVFGDVFIVVVPDEFVIENG